MSTAVFKNPKDYYRYIGSITAIIVVGSWITDLISRKKSSTLFNFLFVLVLELLFLSNSFFTEITIDNDCLEVVYYIFLMKKIKKIDASVISLSLKRSQGRSTISYVINITNKDSGKIIYKINGRDAGWGKEELQEIIDVFERNKGIAGV